MATCENFGKAFEANMNALGLPAPMGLFAAQNTAVSTLSTILGAIEKVGPRATVGELIGATTGLEALMVVASLGAAFYAGAIIGSLIVAADAAVLCTASTQNANAKAHAFVLRRGLRVPSVVADVMRRHPEVLVASNLRASYGMRARSLSQPSMARTV